MNGPIVVLRSQGIEQRGRAALIGKSDDHPNRRRLFRVSLLVRLQQDHRAGQGRMGGAYIAINQRLCGRIQLRTLETNAAISAAFPLLLGMIVLSVAV